MNAPYPKASIHQWLSEPLPADVAQSIQRLAMAGDVVHLAVMPDVHLASEVCVGIAVASQQTIFPNAVGGDIGCGMAALNFDTAADLLDNEKAAGHLLAALYRQVPSLKHSRETMPAELPRELQETPLSDSRLEKLKRRDGRVQFGTLGRGNHFLEFQSDQEGMLWLMVHSGSRAMGQAITEHHLAAAQRSSKSKTIIGLDAASAAGRAYLADHNWSVLYAEQNRLAMIETVSRILEKLFQVRVVPDSFIHCNHNHVRHEDHFVKPLWVHRKGALPAASGEPGVIPGSMGTRSFHVTGRGNELSLQSSSHGAGRAMNRGLAAKTIGIRQLYQEMRGVWFDHRHASRLCDEAPSAYKDISAVMRAQRELTRVERELRPVLCYKG